jgi:tetratricopeptide (TPR) repeat protein
MMKQYLCMITVFCVGVFGLGIAAQSLMAYPLDDPRGVSLKRAAFGLYAAAIDFAKHGNYDQAIAHFNKALEINPEYAEAFNNRGVAYAKGKGQYDKAISDYTKALEISPRLAGAHNNRGIAYGEKHQYDKAV